MEVNRLDSLSTGGAEYLLRRCAAVIDGKGLAVTVVNDSGKNMRLGCQGPQDVLRGIGILECQRRRAVRSQDICQGVQVLEAQFLESIHAVFRERDAGRAQRHERIDHDHQRELAPQRKFARPLHFSSSDLRSVPVTTRASDNSFELTFRRARLVAPTSMATRTRASSTTNWIIPPDADEIVHVRYRQDAGSLQGRRGSTAGVSFPIR